MIKFNLKLYVVPVPVSNVGKNSFSLTMSIFMKVFVAHVVQLSTFHFFGKVLPLFALLPQPLWL